MSSKKRILSGMRPTGPLHLGNLHGALNNWVGMQDEYDCFFSIADWHALTTHYESREVIEKNVYEMVIDWLAAGLDPEQCTIFLQSRLPEHAELFTLLAMGTPLGWLERVPTYKDQQEKLKDKDLSTYGFLGYPVMQGADTAAVVTATRVWLERAVIGLQLCPFAKAVYVNEQVRYIVSEAQTTDALREVLERELRTLAQADASVIDTTLLIHPQVLTDFLDYNDFLDIAEATVEALGLDGVVQIASFHPAYQFAGTPRDDVTNFTNRSPYPMLHLLREASVSRAVAAFPDAPNIYQQNLETMRRLGTSGWTALGLEAPVRATD